MLQWFHGKCRKQLTAEQLQSDNIFLWQVYTDMDINLRQSHIEERAKKQTIRQT